MGPHRETSIEWPRPPTSDVIGRRRADPPARPR